MKKSYYIKKCFFIFIICYHKMVHNLQNEIDHIVHHMIDNTDDDINEVAGDTDLYTRILDCSIEEMIEIINYDDGISSNLMRSSLPPSPTPLAPSHPPTHPIRPSALPRLPPPSARARSHRARRGRGGGRGRGGWRACVRGSYLRVRIEADSLRGESAAAAF